MTRTRDYTGAMLATLPVAGAPGNPNLRGYLREEVQAGNITNLSGTMIAGMGREQITGLLLGETEAVAASPAAPLLSVSAPQPATMAPAGGTDGLGGFAAMLAPYLAHLGGGVNREEVLALAGEAFAAQLGPCRDELASAYGANMEGLHDAFRLLREDMMKRRPVEITVARWDAPKVELGRQHFLLPLVLAVASVRSHAYLVGPAGSGKTSVCHRVASALGLSFRTISVCQQSTKTDLLGYMDAVGTYRGTAFRECYQNGGVFVLDEVDNGNANVLAVLNSALANDGMDFPDARIDRHADFVLIACGNTFGQGADRQYVGRNQLDAATLDRFAFIEFPYDEGFEMELCGITDGPSPAFELGEGGTVRADQWVAFIQGVRAAVDSLKMRAVVSPRASIVGCKLAKAGIGRQWLEKMLVWKGMGETDQSKVRAAMR